MLELFHPGLLWALGLALPLIVLYILKSRRRRRPVASTWLWQEVQRDLEARVPFRRLRRDWLLWLQLLILLLLVLAAAGPYRRLQLGPGDRTAVVLDASASLLAGGRFEAAKRAATELVDALGPADRMVLVRSAATAEVLAPSSSDRRQLREALAAARPAVAPGRLQPAVELAASLAGGEGSVVVITDASAEIGAEGVRVIRVEDGESVENAGIVALGVSPADPSGQDHEVFVRLFNAGDSAVAGRLRLMLDGGLRDAAAVEIPARGETGEVLKLPGVAEGEIEVIWQSAGEDALAADDRAYWVLRSPPPRRYRLLGAAGPYLRRALSANPQWRPAAAEEAADLEIVFGGEPVSALEPSPRPSPNRGRHSPSRPPVGRGRHLPPLLWIDAAAGGETVAGAGVLSWDRTHPALRFVELRAIRFGRLRRAERPPGARVLAETAAGPLILDARVGERRALLWNFDPADSDLPLRAAFPLLVHNALEYLAPVDGGLPGGVAAGVAETVRWPASGPVRLLSPSGRERVAVAEAGVLRMPTLEEVGVWQLDDGQRRLSFGVSLLDEGESDLRPVPKPAAGGGPPGGGRRLEAEAALRGLWRPLALLGLCLLLLEGAAYHRRWVP